MRMKYLLNIAKQILLTEAGLSKVKFAKIIYFVHKDLVKKELSKIEDLAFIRMPLGPVPVGFMEIEKVGSGIFVKEEKTDALIYNAQTYHTSKDSVVELVDEIKSEIRKTTILLARVGTSQLVQRSHEDSSWKKEKNGNEYLINRKDLMNPLPIRVNKSEKKDLDDQKLQGLLLSGMIEDIAIENTQLEYPNYIDNS